tara:strand:+ start:2872 stop:3504 length:633 start_codon:yes stop_codon:yes gene_type:complete
MIIYNFIKNHKLQNYGFLREGVSNSVTEPVTLSQAKAHLRVENSVDDTYITTLISVARSICENYVGYLLANNDSLFYYLDKFPDNEVIYLNGVAFIDSGTTVIKYHNKNDVLTTFSATNYIVDEESIPSRIFLKEDSSFPDTTTSRPSAVRIEFEAGSQGTQVPKAVYQAILMTIGHLYENRQNVVVGARGYELPMTAEYLLNPYRVINV